MTKYYKLRRNDSTRFPKNVVFLDTETVPEHVIGFPGSEAHKLRFGYAIRVKCHNGAIIDRDVFRFTQPNQFWTWFLINLEPRSNCWLVAHKASFDLQVVDFFRMVKEGHIVPNLPQQVLHRDEQTGDADIQHVHWCMGDPPLALGCQTRDKRKVTILDSLNWFPMPAADLGEHVGLPKLDMPADDASIDEWNEYCLRDCEIIEKAVLGFWQHVKQSDYGMVRKTIASQAMGTYRHKFMPDKPPIFNTNPQIRCLERLGYFGGRTDCFMVGTTTDRCVQLDVNSLFPFVMATEKFPRVLMRHDVNQRWTSDLPDFNPRASVAAVLIETTEHDYPYRIAEGAMYCRGRFPTVLCGMELERALINDEVKMIGPWASYELADLFSGFCQHFFAARDEAKQEGNKVADLIAKSILNSLYGKWAQRRHSWQAVHKQHNFGQNRDFFSQHPVTGRWIRYVDISGYVFRRDEGDVRWDWFEPDPGDDEETILHKAGEQVQSMPIISAMVTAAARVFMDQLRRTADPIDVHYQGVDCFICSEAAEQRLRGEGHLHETEPGKLKEIGRGDSCTIYGGMDYAIGDKAVIGHRSMKAKEIGKGFWIDERFSRFVEAAAHPPVGRVFSHKQRRTRKPEYRRGRVDENGRVHSIELQETTDALRIPWQ